MRFPQERDHPVPSCRSTWRADCGGASPIAARPRLAASSKLGAATCWLASA